MFGRAFRSLWGSERRSEATIEEGRRQPMSPSMKRALLAHLPSLAEEDLSAHTHERSSSDYPGVKYDILIYNGDGRAVIEGREFSFGASFWYRVQDSR